MLLYRIGPTFSIVAVLKIASVVIAGAMAPPASSSSQGGVASSSSSSSVMSCAIVGVGALGTSLCQQILQSPAMSNFIVTGITKTTNNHDQILERVSNRKGAKAGGSITSMDDHTMDRFNLLTADQATANGIKFDTVVFCAPPSGFDNYPKAMQDTINQFWKGPISDRGIFVFTSSGAVYGGSGSVGAGGIVTESTPTSTEPTGNPRIDRLVQAEQTCLGAGGCCLRLAGLYSLQRGPHHFWLTSGKDINGNPQGIVNMLHYDDAAAACLAAIRAGPTICENQIFLISDGNPITREGICRSALQATVYSHYSMPQFITNNDGSGDTEIRKIYDGTVSNQRLNWQPVYRSFDDYMKMNSS